MYGRLYHFASGSATCVSFFVTVWRMPEIDDTHPRLGFMGRGFSDSYKRPSNTFGTNDMVCYTMVLFASAFELLYHCACMKLSLGLAANGTLVCDMLESYHTSFC